MKERPIDPHALHVSSFSADAASCSGRWPLAGLGRLLDSLYESPTPEDGVDWQAQGSQLPATGGEPEIWLQLRGTASVTLQCQRCLKAVRQPLSVDRRFRFVRSEEEAERLDETSEDDVLVLQPRLDLQELLEDELILALPLVARHEGDCPDPLPLPTDDLEDEEPAPNPFAALAALRGRGGVK
jgi:uncharacterized protein